MIYSASSTDSMALTERLTAYNAFEAEMNECYGLCFGLLSAQRAGVGVQGWAVRR